LEQNVGYLLLKLSFPAVCGMLIHSGFSLIDTYYVARLGPKPMAALTLCIPVLILISSIASSTGTGLTSLIARTLGSGDAKSADNVAWHGLAMSIVCGVLTLIIGNSICNELLLLFGSTPETFKLSKDYLHIVFWGSTFLFIPVCMSSIIQGEGNILFPMVASLVGMGINVALDPVLIFGFGPIRPLGLNGAAMATVLSQVISGVLIGGYVAKKQGMLTWSLRNYRPSMKVIWGIYRVGLPAMAMDIAGIIIMVYLNQLLASFGYTAIAVLGIFLRIRSLVYMPVFGLAQGTMPIASFAYGAGINERVKETLVKASVISFLMVGIGWAIVQAQPAWIFGKFSPDPEVVAMGATCIWLSTLFLPLMGPLAILYTVLQSIGKGFTAMWLSLLRQLGFFLPLLLVLPDYFGLNGVWVAFSLSELMSVFLAFGFMINTWRGLDSRGKVSIVIRLNPPYLFKRLSAWMKWNQGLF
jgi:putative MATE family efflux protein